MVDRYKLTTDLTALQLHFIFEERPPLRPRYNVAPGQVVPIVRRNGQGFRSLALVRWGFAPTPEAGGGNGRGPASIDRETAETVEPFREAFASRRCLVLADGFYAWRKGAEPFLVQRRDGRPLGFAGLWARQASPDGGPVESCVVLTMAANAAVAAISDRMPAIVDPARYIKWLNPKLGGMEVLLPCPADRLEAVRVNARIHSPDHDGPDLLDTAA